MADGARCWSDEMYRVFGRDPALGPTGFEELARTCPSADWGRLVSAATQVQAQGGTFEVDLRVDRPNGATCWIVARGEGVCDASGKVVVMRGTVQDVSDRRKADESFRAVRSELEAIVQASPFPIIALDPNGNVFLWSTAAERLFGWTSAEVVGRPVPIVPEDKRAEYDQIRSTSPTPVSALLTVRQTRDGRRIPVSLSTAPLLGPDGEPKGMVGVFIDLTEQKALRQALVESEQRFASAFEASPMAKVLIRLADHRIVEANRACLELFGISRDEIIDKDAFTLGSTPPSSRRIDSGR